MKYLNKIILGIICIAGFLAACDKVDVVPTYKNGTPPVLSSSASTVVTQVSDSNTNVVKFSWTNPMYATDSATQKFVLEFDTSANFTHEVTVVENGSLDTSLTGNQLNTILSQFGLAIGVPSALNVRVTSSYANNNEQYKSNVIAITAAPYITPIVLTPSSTNALTLSVNNSADTVVTFNWTAAQYGTDTTTYALQFDTVGGKFASPQLIEFGTSLYGGIVGDSLNLDAIAAGISAGASGNLEFRIVGYLGDNYTKPSVFSDTVKINVTTFLPFFYLYVPGDYQGWNPAAAPTLGSTVPNVNAYEGYVYVPAGGTDQFKLTTGPAWSFTAYGDAGSGTSGTLSTSGGNMMWPAGAANGAYCYLNANTSALTWSALVTTWSVIGDATPGGWSTDTQLTYDPNNNDWYINGVTLTAGGSIKFRANDEWNDPHFPGTQSNLGGSLTNLSYGGANIPITQTGTYNIVLNLSSPLNYTATITQ